jgi:hypothetical protein
MNYTSYQRQLSTTQDGVGVEVGHIWPIDANSRRVDVPGRNCRVRVALKQTACEPVELAIRNDVSALSEVTTAIQGPLSLE